MRYWTSALVLLAAAGRTASAQVPPAPGEQPPPPPTDPAPPPPTPPPRPPVVPAPPPPPPPAAPEGAEYRPSELSLAIGFGYRLPTKLDTPNTASVRLRFPSGLTLEPRLTLAASQQEVDTGPSAKDKSNELGLGATVRFPLVRHGRVDLEVLGGLDLDRENTSPDAPDMDLTITTFTAVYGFAVGTWITPHWQVSLSALNPVISNTRRNEQMGPGTSTVTTTTTIGVIFDPSVVVMVHLYH
jgi:hypothetical protein